VIIPSKDPLRQDKVIWIRDACMLSRTDRLVMYQRRRRFFLFGTYGQEKVIYNRLMAHIDLVASFLYAADHCRYNLSAPRNSDEVIQKQVLALGEDWNDEFRSSGIADQYTIGLMWSLIYDCMFMKIGWGDRGGLFGKLIPPNAFAVFDETEPDLDSQEAFVHTYRVNWDNAVLRLLRAGLGDRIKDLRTESTPSIDDMPPVMAQMIISNTGGVNLGGPMMGQVMPDYEPQGYYEAKSDIPTVQFQEVWVWDDFIEDYVIFTIADPDIILTDSRETVSALAKASDKKLAQSFKSESNIYLPEEHPFVPIRPYEMFDYFWGEAHSERLIPLQKWTNERLDQIHEILEMQVDPAKVFSGFMGLQDEKAMALGGPGTWVSDQLPGASVKELKPDMPEDLFAELKEIGSIFLEASGLTETVTGHGEKDVRSKGHAKQLAMTGSGRIRKVAVGLEGGLQRIGDLGVRLKMRNSNIPIIPDKPATEFLPAQLATEHWNLKVAGHSHSPLFADDSRELASAMFKARAIDREMLVRLLNPPNADEIIANLRKRVVAEQQQAAQNPQQPQTRGRSRKAA
jgi:hypothetical protein